MNCSTLNEGAEGDSFLLMSRGAKNVEASMSTDNVVNEEYCSHCEGFMGRLTDWERGFIESIRERLDGGQGLSEKQAEVLERIYCKLP
jgi:hypothetical protein